MIPPSQRNPQYPLEYYTDEYYPYEYHLSVPCTIL